MTNLLIKEGVPAIFQRFSVAKLHEVLRQMHLIRQFEEGAEQAYMRGLVHGTMHLSIGQEASATGATAAPAPSPKITHVVRSV